MGKLLGNIKEQTVGYIALAQGSDPNALREVVLTKIPDWDGKNLGALILGFPVRNMTGVESERDGAVSSGIWLGEQLYIEGISAHDRRALALRITEAMSRQAAGHFSVTLESGPHFVFYKALDPKTQLEPAYEVCLYPLADALREQRALRWKIMASGLVVLIIRFAASHFISQRLSKPVDEMVAGSVQNLTLRRRAEEDCARQTPSWRKR